MLDATTSHAPSVSNPSASSSYYTPTDITAATGLSSRTVRTYLRERFPRHQAESWWRFEAHTFEMIVRELRAAQRISGKQPRRVLKQVMSRERMMSREQVMNRTSRGPSTSDSA